MIRGLINRLFGGSSGDLPLIEAVSNHVEKWVGPIETVLHEKVSPTVHVDLHWVKPGEGHPFHTLVTSGMAERPMKAPKEAAGCTHAELILLLPSTWPMDELTTNEGAYWPIRIMKTFARYPHQQATWLWEGHSVPIAHEGQTMAPGTRFESVMLTPPLLFEEGFESVVMADGRTVFFFVIAFLDPAELELKLDQGSEAVIDRAKEQGRLEELLVVTPNRASFVA